MAVRRSRLILEVGPSLAEMPLQYKDRISDMRGKALDTLTEVRLPAIALTTKDHLLMVTVTLVTT